MEFYTAAGIKKCVPVCSVGQGLELGGEGVQCVCVPVCSVCVPVCSVGQGLELGGEDVQCVCVYLCAAWARVWSWEVRMCSVCVCTCVQRGPGSGAGR